MRLIRLLTAAGLILFGGFGARAENYTVKENTWECFLGPGALQEVSAHKWKEIWPRDVIEHSHSAGCVPIPQGPVKAQVLAFLGEYAYLCDKVKAAPGTGFFCFYLLTADLFDSKGNSVKPHFSKTSPSPHFFDGD